MTPAALPGSPFQRAVGRPYLSVGARDILTTLNRVTLLLDPMPSRRGVLASIAATIGSGLVGCLARSRGISGGVDRRLVERTGTTAPVGVGAGRSDSGVSAPVTRSYAWAHDGTGYGVDVEVPDALLSYCRSRPRVRHRGAYVADPYHDGLLTALAGELDARAGPAASPLDLARTFVQHVPYETDRESTGIHQYARYPAETLAAGRGDCEDLAIVLSGLLERLGHDTVLLAFWEANHMGLGLATDESVTGRSYHHDGTRYAYVETASPGWSVGEVPGLVGTEVPEVMPVGRLPTLVADWATGQWWDGLRTRVTVRNVGDAPAEAVRVGLSLASPAGEVLAGRHSQARRVTAGDESTHTVAVSPPDPANVDRARIAVTTGGTVVDDVVVGSGSGGAAPTGRPGRPDAGPVLDGTRTRP